MGFSEEEKMFQNKGTQQVAHASSNAVNEPVAIYNSDGTSYVINGNILREYDASNKLVSERELSAEEKATSPSVVLKNLSNSSSLMILFFIKYKEVSNIIDMVMTER